jgi:hypothetical protein
MKTIINSNYLAISKIGKEEEKNHTTTTANQLTRSTATMFTY